MCTRHGIRPRWITRVSGMWLQKKAKLSFVTRDDAAAINFFKELRHVEWFGSLRRFGRKMENLTSQAHDLHLGKRATGADLKHNTRTPNVVALLEGDLDEMVLLHSVQRIYSVFLRLFCCFRSSWCFLRLHDIVLISFSVSATPSGASGIFLLFLSLPFPSPALFPYSATIPPPPSLPPSFTHA